MIYDIRRMALSIYLAHPKHLPQQSTNTVKITIKNIDTIRTTLAAIVTIIFI